MSGDPAGEVWPQRSGDIRRQAIMWKRPRVRAESGFGHERGPNLRGSRRIEEDAVGCCGPKRLGHQGSKLDRGLRVIEDDAFDLESARLESAFEITSSGAA